MLVYPERSEALWIGVVIIAIRFSFPCRER